ncbi:MAG: hypothetical protein ACRDKT_02785 [Actinomycetota bacterium]
MFKRIALIALSLVVAVGGYGIAGAAPKKKPKPYKSEVGTTGIPHPIVYGSTGSVNAITAKEFEAQCATPASNGLDGYVFEVPKEYQNRVATVYATAESSATGVYDLDMYVYDKNCVNTLAINAVGTDEVGVFGKGTAWIFVHNYQGEPGVGAFIEIKP